MKVCFVAQHIYPYLDKAAQVQTAGGAELQQLFIGKGLKEKGYDISYVTLDFGQKDGEALDGFKIYPSFKPHEGLYGIRFYYPRLYKIWKALEKAMADLYYVRCATFLPGVVGLFCKKNKKKFVFAGAHDTNFMPGNLRLPTKRDELFYRYGLKCADAVVVQSEKQKTLLKENFGKDSKVIRNFYPLESKKIPLKDRKIILWVSTIKTWKRPEQFLNLAKKFPSEVFVMIGGRPGIGDNGLYYNIQQSANNVRNLRFLGFQPIEETERYFDQCKLFVNTSEYEGFPNTFLQAWNRGIPVISYVDPDEIIKKNQLGYVVESENEMEKALSSFISEDKWSFDSIIWYFQNNHCIQIIKEYDILIKSLF